MISDLDTLVTRFGLWQGIAIGEFILLVAMYLKTVPRDIYNDACSEKASLIAALDALGPATDKLLEFVKLLVERGRT